MRSETESMLARARARRSFPQPKERRRLREMVNLTQAEVAQLIGTRRENVSRYELGRRQPRGEIADRYGQLLKRFARELHQ